MSGSWFNNEEAAKVAANPLTPADLAPTFFVTYSFSFSAFEQMFFFFFFFLPSIHNRIRRITSWAASTINVVVRSV